jgi:tRNA(fMet)-specific endonuclease VapC
MKQYLLDTCTCIEVIRRNGNVQQKIFSVGCENCGVSEITIAELYYGAGKSGKEKHLHDVEEIMRYFAVVPIFSSLRTYGEVKAALERQGNRLDDMDLLIGSTALYNGMTLVTHNTRHLSRIPGLEIEDWE